jgi:hypothetical protein
MKEGLFIPFGFSLLNFYRKKNKRGKKSNLLMAQRNGMNLLFLFSFLIGQ